MNLIIDGRGLYGKSLADYLTWEQFIAVGIQRGWKPPRLDTVAEVEPLAAWVQQGQYVVTCPDCADRPDNELQAVWWPEGPLVMFCTLCGNVSTGGRVRPVRMPSDLDAALALLAVRPLHQRTWRPGEPLTTLLAENVAHGLTSPEDALAATVGDG